MRLLRLNYRDGEIERKLEGGSLFPSLIDIYDAVFPLVAVQLLNPKGLHNLISSIQTNKQSRLDFSQERWHN